MLDSLVRSPNRLLGRPSYNTTLHSTHQVKGAITPSHPLFLYGCHSLVLALS